MATKILLTGGVAAIAVMLCAVPAKADCAWSIGMLKHDVALVENIAPLAAAAGKDVQAKYQSALDGAKSALALAVSLSERGDNGACEYAVERARLQTGAARESLPKPKSG